MTPVLSILDRPLAAGDGARRTTWLGGIDPRARILAASAFAVLVVLCDGFPALALALGLSLALLAASRLPPRQTLRRMATMDGFILFILVMLPFTVPGEPLFTLWGFSASREGFRQAIEIALKANAIILALMALVATMEAVTLGHALHALRVPARLVHLLLFTVRYIDVLRAEYLRLRQAMRARGFRPTTGWHCYRSFGYLVGMLLVRSLERSERILGAMKCRGFTGRIPMLEEMRYGPADRVFAIGVALALAGLAMVEIGHAAL